MDARQIKCIDVSGHNGMPAPEFWDKLPAEAPIGQSGKNGRSAGVPTAGTAASDIRIRLAYSAEEPGLVQVTGEGPHTGNMWKVSRDEKMLLNAKGGDGGTGGRGEDGQAGGRGRDGRDATRHRNGGDGEDGASGGDGGYGSDGAAGAAGGNIFVTVHDEDTDLLVPMEFNVRGGAGGVSGEHGEPGDGGAGGRGGAPYAWTERHGDRVSAHTRPGGVNGRNGPPGSRPATNLSGGSSGPNGSIQIKVIRGDLSEATYPSVYALQVVKFDIIDENEDGINEPGEHILVHNIKVRNIGGMPSPEQRSIKLLIQGTQFLDPIASQPLELPRSIQPGQEVNVPGILKAFIRNEFAEKAPGQRLNFLESISIVAHFDERLNRPIPNFCGASQIYISYPLVLDAPSYLDCVAKGDTVRFRWVVHNNSRKPYGIDSALRRAAATRLSDPNRFFSLTHATSDKPDEATDEIEEFEPNSTITIDQDISVSHDTMEFSEGYLALELLLCDPKTGTLRSVEKHMMHMQISGVYTLSPNPSYLLVVNSKTPNHAIHKIIALVRHRLHTQLDIFNLSLTGSYSSPVTKQNVLKSYEGKSVIIFGNAFPYFHSEPQDPWSLLDSSVAGLLLKADTNILFISVENQKGLGLWASRTTFPAHDFIAASQPVNEADLAKVVAAIKGTGPKPVSPAAAVHRFPVQKGFLGNIQSTVDSKAISAAKTLDKNFPLRRFLVVPDIEAAKAAEDKQTGGVIIAEGVPKTSNMMAAVEAFAPASSNGHGISNYHMYFIVSCLPFKVKTAIFWNIVGRGISAGVPAETAYKGLSDFYHATPSKVNTVDAKILEALCISLQFAMSDEIYRFCSTRPRFSDPISAAEKMQQLPLITQFFAAVPQGASHVADAASAQLFVLTLGTVHAMANPLSSWQSIKHAFAWLGNRKAQLTPILNEQIFQAITAACSSSEVAATVKEHMLQRSKQVKASIKAKGGKKNYAFAFGQMELADFTGMQGTFAANLMELNLSSMALGSTALNSHVQSYQVHQETIRVLENRAKTVLTEHVSPVDED